MATNDADQQLTSFFDDLVRCETRLYNAIGEKLRTAHALNTSQLELLRYVREHPQCRVADAATYFAAGVGAISKAVDRLEARGWIARHRNPTDRRSSLVGLTEDGAALLAEADSTYVDSLAALLEPIAEQREIASAAAALRTLRQALERQRIGMPTG